MRTTRLTTVLTGTFAGVLLLAGPASAHVSVKSSEAKQGGYAKLTFRVPNEKDVATTKLEVAFPAASPIKSVSVKPHAGWTYVATKAKPAGSVDEVVIKITWTATAGGIKPGEFDEFEVSAGPLPKVDALVFKALQTYADGDVVRWIEQAPAGSKTEPEHPAPVLELAASTEVTAGGDHPAGASASAAPAASAAPSVSATPVAGTKVAGESDSSTTLGIAGLAVAAAAALLALAALVRGGRKNQV